MSGGSYDYAYQKVEDMASSLSEQRSPLRRAFGAHLKLVAKAMHDIEWADSCDYKKGDERPAIIDALEDCTGQNEMGVLVEDVKCALAAFQESLAKLVQEARHD